MATMAAEMISSPLDARETAVSRNTIAAAAALSTIDYWSRGPHHQRLSKERNPKRESKGGNPMNLKQAIVGILTVGCVIGTALLLPGVSQAQDAKVKAAMELLKSMAEKLGPAAINGTDKVADKDVPAIYFGSTKINNNFALVDEVVKEVGGTATIFVKSGDDYIRVSTNVPKPDGSGRAIGTMLDPKGKAIESIKKNEAFYGDVDILGKPYTTGYEPIHDTSKNVIGIFYVGYPK
jgi:hypothetical protein